MRIKRIPAILLKTCVANTDFFFNPESWESALFAAALVAEYLSTGSAVMFSLDYSKLNSTSVAALTVCPFRCLICNEHGISFD